jgi:DnaK suppressor protein
MTLHDVTMHRRIRSSSIRRISMPTQKTLGILALAGVNPYVEKPKEEYMNGAQLEHFKKILDAWRIQLRQEVDRTVTNMQDEAANFPDPVDRAAQEEEFSLELRTRDRERKLIKKIEKTLQLIEDDDFGFCNSCGIEIGIRRLEARPTADLCIECKTLQEIKERQLAG